MLDFWLSGKQAVQSPSANVHTASFVQHFTAELTCVCQRLCLGAAWAPLPPWSQPRCHSYSCALQKGAGSVFKRLLHPCNPPPPFASTALSKHGDFDRLTVVFLAFSDRSSCG